MIWTFFFYTSHNNIKDFWVFCAPASPLSLSSTHFSQQETEYCKFLKGTGARTRELSIKNENKRRQLAWLCPKFNRSNYLQIQSSLVMEVTFSLISLDIFQKGNAKTTWTPDRSSTPAIYFQLIDLKVERFRCLEDFISALLFFSFDSSIRGPVQVEDAGSATSCDWWRDVMHPPPIGSNPISCFCCTSSVV